MIIHDWGKMSLLGSIIVSVTVLAVAGVVSGDQVMGLLGLIVGYLVGNGVNALRRQPPSPVLAPTLTVREMDEVTDDGRP